MTNPQQVINESKPMLEELLSVIGLHRMGTPLDLPQLLEPFSRWVDEQEVTAANRLYLTVRLAAFICEYLIDVRSGERVVEGGRILMRVPIQEGVLREFDPYSVAIGVATNRNSLKEFLDFLTPEGS